MRQENMTAGQQLAELMNGRIIPAVNELRARWDRLYPAVRVAPRVVMLACHRCGHQVDQSRIGDGAYQRKMIAGRHLGHPDFDGPDEFVTVCPDCGASESFREIFYKNQNQDQNQDQDADGGSL
jgi:hypothetical protein